MTEFSPDYGALGGIIKRSRFTAPALVFFGVSCAGTLAYLANQYFSNSPVLALGENGILFSTSYLASAVPE